jgi:T5SS/PEP-CTERM-associated repeat protein/autotransporter passenger strand-loop-strand repeat protein
MAAFTWTGAGDGLSWSDPMNWANSTTGESPASSPPGSGDDVTISSAATVDGDSSAEANNLYVTGANEFDGMIEAQNAYISTTLSIVGNLQTDVFLSISDATTTVQSGGSIDAFAPMGTTAAAQVDGYGTLDVDGGQFNEEGSGVIVGYSSWGTLTVEDGATAGFTQSETANAVLTIGFLNGSFGQVTVDGQGSSLTTNVSNINLGYGGEGDLYVQDGASATAQAGIDLGGQDDGSGYLQVSDDGSTFTVTSGDFVVGYLGQGSSVEVDSGGSISDEDATLGMVIAAQPGSTGDLYVTDDGSNVSVEGGLVVGDGGDGTLEIENGATVSAASVDVAAQDTSGDTASDNPSEVTVDGSGSSLTLTGLLTVGDAGYGVVEIRDAGAATAESLDIATQSSSGSAADTVWSFVHVDGSDSSLIINGDGFVGDGGLGALTISNGAKASLESLDIAAQESSGSTEDDVPSYAAVSGEGSELDVANGIFVGDGGFGNITIIESGTVAADTIDVAVQETSGQYGPTHPSTSGVTGSPSGVYIDGSGSTLAISGGAFVGDAGFGYIEVFDGASMTAASIDIAVQATSGDPSVLDESFIEVNNDGSNLNVAGDAIVGDAGYGALTVFDGATASIGGDLIIAAQASSGSQADSAPSFVDVDGADSALTVTGSTTIGEAGDGILGITDGGVFTTGGASLILAAQEGSTGELDLDGANSKLAFSGDITVGESGDGTFDLADDANYTVTGDLTLGSEENSSGALDIESNATLTVDGDLILGAEGEGDMTISDGNLTVEGNVYSGTGTIDFTGDPLIQGDLFIGIVTPQAGAAGLTPTAFATWTFTDPVGNDPLIVTGSTHIGVGAGDIGVLTVTGAHTTMTSEMDFIVGDGGNGTLNVQNAATVNVGGALTLGAQPMGAGQLTVNGNGSVVNAGTADVTIGYDGTGAAAIQMGGLLDAQSVAVWIATEAGSIGALTVTNDQSELDAGTLVVGGEGTATATISDGGAFDVAGDATIGNGGNGAGTVTVADAQSSFDVGGDLTVGYDGVGDFVVDGDTSTAGDLFVGSQSDGQGQITVNVATLDDSGDATIGDNGSGSILVQLAGAFEAQNVTLAEALRSSGTLTVDGDGTTATTDDLAIGVAGQGALNVTDGAILTTTGDATLGDAVSANVQTAKIDTQALWSIGGDLVVGGSGIATMTVSGGANAVAGGDIVIGDQSAASGLATVTGQVTNQQTGDTSASGLGWGGTLIVGNFGDGALTVEDGALAAPTPNGDGLVEIAAQAGSQGGVTVTGDGSLLSAADLDIGGGPNAAGGGGTLTAEQGGLVEVANDITMWNGALDVANGGQVQLGAPGLFQPTPNSLLVTPGGALTGDGTIDGDVELGGGTIDAEDGRLTIDGDVTGGGAIDIGAGATLEVAGSVGGNVSIDFDAAAGETLQIDGTTMPNAVIRGFALGDTIDLAGVSFASGGTAYLSLGGSSPTTLVVNAEGATYNLNLAEATSAFSNVSIRVVSDGSGAFNGAGGTEIQLSDGPSINFNYDSSVANAGNAQAIEHAFRSAATILEGDFTNPVTVNINAGWGEVGGAAGAVGSPVDTGGKSTFRQAFPVSYTQIYDALQSIDPFLPPPTAPNNPYANLKFIVPAAELQALGLGGGATPVNNSFPIDGSSGFAVSGWSFNNTGSYDIIGAIEHEITEIMGRVSSLGTGNPPGYYEPMDLFRYLGPGAPDLTPGGGPVGVGVDPTAYFSLDNGVTNLGTWNNYAAQGDLGDWYPPGAPAANDAFNYIETSGGPAPVSINDLLLMNALGWNETVAGPPVSLPFFNAQVTSGNVLNVAAGNTASGTIINSGGVETDYGSDAGATLSGEQDVYGSAVDTTVDSGGFQIVENGGVASATTINSGGVESVAAGGAAAGVTFGGVSATLDLAQPSGLTGAISNWQVGDAIDFLNTSVTSANVSGSTLTVNVSGGQAYSYQLIGQQGGASVSVQGDGAAGADVFLTNSSLTTPSQMLGGPYSGNENATIALTGLTVSASPNAGDPLSAVLSVSDGTLMVGSQTGASVTLTGTAATIDAELSAGVTYTPNTDFSGSDALSLTTTDTADAQSVTGSAAITVNQFPAIASVASTVSLGNVRIGASDNEGLSIGNVASAGSSNLDASVGSTSGDATASGSFTGLAAGSTDGSDITVGLNTSQAGAPSGSVTLNFASDAGGGNVTALPSQTVQVSGNVYREASASIAALPSKIIVHVGDVVSDPLTITNTAANDGYSENLIASVAGVSGAITASGSTGDIAAQATSNAIAIGFSTASAGNVTGSVTLDFQSDGTGVDGLGTVDLGPQTINVNAAVDNYATAALEELSGAGTLSGTAASGYTLNLGTVLLGSTGPSVNLEALNTATGPSDLLEGAFVIGGSSPGSFTNSGFGSFTGLAAGQSDTAPTVTLNTSSAGTFSETITFDPTGYNNASGYSGALAPEALTVTGAVVGAVPVSYFLANQSSLDALGSFTVKDSWAHVLAQLGALSADQHLTSIQLTDPTAPVMTLTALQAVNDARALSVLSAPWSYALTISDAPSALAGLTPTQIAALKAEGIASIAATGPVLLSIAVAAAYEESGYTIQVPQGDTVTVADTAADIAAITLGEANALKAAGYKSIASINGAAVTLTASAALTLYGDGLKVTGGTLTVADSGTDIGLLAAANVTALKTEGVTAITATGSVHLTVASAIAFQQAGFTINVPQGSTVSVTDTTANIEALNTTEMANLGAVGISSLTATDAGINLTLAQALAFQGANLTLSAPKGSVAIVDTVADLGRALTASEIAKLPALGVTKIQVTNGNLSLTAAQTAAIIANDLTVTASGNYTVTENFSDGAYTVYQDNVSGQSYGSFEQVYDDTKALAATAYDNLDGTGALSLNENGLTTTVGSGLLSVQTSAATGGDVFPLAAHSNETINAATNLTNETFVFQPAFGQDTLNGFVATGADSLVFNAASFGFTGGSNSATDLATLIANGMSHSGGAQLTSTSAGGSLFTDAHGDTLTLAAVSVATLQNHSSSVAFK